MKTKKLRKICESYINANFTLNNWVDILQRVLVNSNLQECGVKENDRFAIAHCMDMLRETTQKITKQNREFLQVINTADFHPDSAPECYTEWNKPEEEYEDEE